MIHPQGGATFRRPSDCTSQSLCCFTTDPSLCLLVKFIRSHTILSRHVVLCCLNDRLHCSAFPPVASSGTDVVNSVWTDCYHLCPDSPSCASLLPANFMVASIRPFSTPASSCPQGFWVRQESLPVFIGRRRGDTLGKFMAGPHGDKQPVTLMHTPTD